MGLKFFNPLFLWKKRRSILNRISEIPDDLRWKIAYPYIKRGYVANRDFDRILNLKNIHKGKTAFFLGNGPSVKPEDLNKVSNTDFIVFGCNRIHLAYDQFDLRPDYLVSADEQMIESFGTEMIENNSRVLFVSKRKPLVPGDFTWFKEKNGRPFRFSREVTKHVMVGGGTIIAAMQIAYHMGIKKFYIYGVDHSFSFKRVKGKYANASGDTNHFIKNYRSGKTWQAPVTDLVEQSFSTTDKLLREDDGFVINATRGGKLEVLERRKFEEILE